MTAVYAPCLESLLPYRSFKKAIHYFASEHVAQGR